MNNVNNSKVFLLFFLHQFLFTFTVTKLLFLFSFFFHFWHLFFLFSILLPFRTISSMTKAHISIQHICKIPLGWQKQILRIQIRTYRHGITIMDKIFSFPEMSSLDKNPHPIIFLIKLLLAICFVLF